MDGFYSYDLLIIGINYTESSINENGQYLSEVFYRFTVSKTFAKTPSMKMILNPSLDQEVDQLFY